MQGRASAPPPDYFASQGVDFGLLVCERELLPFYARFGWREFTGSLLVTRHGTVCPFALCRVMTVGVASEAPRAGVIDLRGPPW